MSLPYQVEELIQIIELILNLYLTKEQNYPCLTFIDTSTMPAKVTC